MCKKFRMNNVFKMLLSILFISISLFAQSQSWIVNYEKAKQRIANYKDKKKPLLDSLANGYETDSIVVDAANFVDAITNMTNTTGCNGVTFYFISFDTDINAGNIAYKKMSVICVPSFVENPQSDRGTINDKLTNIWYLRIKRKKGNVLKGSFIKVNNTNLQLFLNKWRNPFRANKLTILQQGLPSSISESKAIWYSTAILGDTNIKNEPGMVRYIRDSGVKQVSIIFSANSSGEEYAHKLNLLFGLNGDYTALARYDLEKKLDSLRDLQQIADDKERDAEIHKLEALLAAYGDTGKPCPPFDCN